MAYVLVIALSFGLATAIIGTRQGQLVLHLAPRRLLLPLLGLIAVILYRVREDEPERRCPRCGTVHKLYVQVCARCGEDMYLPDPREIRRPSSAELQPGALPMSSGALPVATLNPMRAADALCEALKAEGVKHVFGIPGGANLPTYDALYDADIEHIQVRHEQCGGHAAEGYAKASGKVGVALATSGPGATNMVTAIADAMMDSVPTVFITGQVRTDLIGTDGFQEADVTGITLPIVKHSFMVTDPRQIPEYIHDAFHIASTGRPGPVLVDVPQDLSRADIEYEPLDGHARAARLQAHDRGQHQADPARGEGARQRPAAGDLRRRRRSSTPTRRRSCASSAARTSFPVTFTVMGLGAFPAPARAVAGDARHARDPDRQLRDGRRRPDRRRRARASTTASPASSPSSPRARSSSTSTSTRPRSRRTSPPTSRSSATPRTCSRS